jgi:hypothetical protein
MKKLLVAAVFTLSWGLVAAAPAAAAGAFSQTVHISTLQDVLAPGCTGPASAIRDNATGNGVMHFNVNGTGDWFTATFEGQDTLTEGLAGPLDSNGNTTFIDNGGPTFQGHMMEWFGFEGNHDNQVAHATFNFKGTNVADATMTLSIHAELQMTVNANATVTVTRFTLTCS